MEVVQFILHGLIAFFVLDELELELFFIGSQCIVSSSRRFFRLAQLVRELLLYRSGFGLSLSST